VEQPETVSPGPPLGSLGRYQLLQKLGQGGMGTVYLALDTRLDRRVAVKVLPTDSVHDPDAVARFQREAKALAKLSHPGIVQAYDAEEHQGQHFLVMEYVEGTSLERLLVDKGHLTPGVAADFVHQAALALQHAHDRGLVHRDLKPSNLLLTGEKRIKILDLGLARFLQDQVDPGRTREGTGMGTPDYAAPEQFRDAHQADTRADIYSLGCTLYHLLAGRVPFPGSSLSEKCKAHEHKEPVPLEELCPETPAGLALVVQRMMAKRPADRFQTAGELCEALAPYVASASLSASRLKTTHSWHGGQLTVTTTEFSRRRRLLPWAITAVAVVALLAMSVAAWPRLFPVGRTPSTASDGGGETAPAAGQASDKTAGPSLPADPNVLTVSKDEKTGGQFRTIGAALEQVKPGMTIRVLDDAVYREVLVINRRAQHAGLTLEAPRRAILETTGAAGVLISGVPRVTLRGLHVRVLGQNGNGVVVHSSCPGVILEQLEIDVRREVQGDGILFQDVELDRDDPPAVARDCRIVKPKVGITASGTSAECKRILIQGNRIEDSGSGIWVMGAVQQVHIVGNRITGASLVGIQFQHLADSAQSLLVANNTVFDSSTPFRLWDQSVKAKNVELCNNLFLGRPEAADMLFIDSGGDTFRARGPGDGERVAKAWRIAHNAREARSVRMWGKDRIPPGKTDLVREKIDVLSREAASPDYLRPAKDSPLATAGAGVEDPSLPRYIGAVPPQGVEAWDWSRTWRMPRPGQLLTVSKNASDGGQYRSIGEALAAAKPWATVRVLDNATYAEPLVLDKPKEQEGISLEAIQQATLQMKAGFTGALAIDGVHHVRVSGFRFRQTGAPLGSALVSLRSGVSGVVLEGCDLQGGRGVDGVRIFGRADVGEAPVVIAHCAIQDAFLGIRVQGTQPPGTAPLALRSIMIRDNRLTRVITGIILLGAVADTQVTGNLIWDFQQSAMQIQDLGPGSERILFANNSAFQGPICLRVWDTAPHKKYEPGQVEIRNNLLFRAVACDMSFVLDPNDGTTKTRPGDGQALIKQWRFDHNWRDLSGDEVMFVIPRAPADRHAEKIDVLSREPAHADFLRPPPGSELAREGAGKVDASLPTYVGGVPPAGVAPWDWGRTWRWRSRMGK
jgi:nitrous oxidase accessory protein NosD